MSDVCNDCGRLIFARETHDCSEDKRGPVPGFRGNPTTPERSSWQASYQPVPQLEGDGDRIQKVIKETLQASSCMYYLDGIAFAITRGCLEVLNILEERSKK